MKTQTGVDKYLWWLCFNVLVRLIKYSFNIKADLREIHNSSLEMKVLVRCGRPSVDRTFLYYNSIGICWKYQILRLDAV
jgi:hypothetical protein